MIYSFICENVKKIRCLLLGFTDTVNIYTNNDMYHDTATSPKNIVTRQAENIAGANGKLLHLDLFSSNDDDLKTFDRCLAS